MKPTNVVANVYGSVTLSIKIPSGVSVIRLKWYAPREAVGVHFRQVGIGEEDIERPCFSLLVIGGDESIVYIDRPYNIKCLVWSSSKLLTTLFSCPTPREVLPQSK